MKVEHWDLWDGTLPAFGPPAVAAKMAIFGGANPAGAEATAWQTAFETFPRFDSADRYLFSVPMWNAAVPYILKQLIDVVSQPGMIFGFDPTATPACSRTSGSPSSTPVRSTGPIAARASATTSSSLLRGLAALGRHRRHPQHRVPPQPGHRRPGARTPRRARPSHPGSPRIPVPGQTSPAGRVTSPDRSRVATTTAGHAWPRKVNELPTATVCVHAPLMPYAARATKPRSALDRATVPGITVGAQSQVSLHARKVCAA